jgi:hypothetical protein
LGFECPGQLDRFAGRDVEVLADVADRIDHHRHT